jgi:hypothetical protein
MKLLGGSDAMATTILSWPKGAQTFFFAASEFIGSQVKNRMYERDWVASLNETHKGDKPYAPVPAYLAQATLITLGHREFDVDAISALHEAYSRIPQEQARWLQQKILTLTG